MGRAQSLLVTIAVVGSACSPPFGLDERLALDVARERWDERPFQDYVFEAQHSCFCTPEQVGPVRITVRQGSIESVVLLETGSGVDSSLWFTMERFFELIPLFGKQNGVEEVDVEYDGTLWYPSSVRVRYGEDVLDAGSHYTITAVGPAP